MSAFKNVSKNFYTKDFTFLSETGSVPRSGILNRQQYTHSTRVRKILLANRNQLNNAVEVLSNSNDTVYNTKTLNNQSSFDLANTNCINEISLIKKPFKHFKHPISSNAKLLNRSISVSSNEKKLCSDTSSINLMPKTPQTQRSIQNLSSNPSTTLILKTANVLNDFVDYFEKYRNQNPVISITNIKPKRFSKYSGLKPLLNSVGNAGPAIENCMGIIKEPKSKRNQKLKEIYEYKLKLLEIKQNEANMVNLIEDEMFYADKDQDSLKRFPETE